ncbi:MAG: hypothetical protein JO301_02315 [Chitinophagaceae bacterium]|nr:hypothetical protein [Chitinophagaceae bacterium]
MKQANILLAIVIATVMNAQAQVDKPPLLMGDMLYTFRYENIQGTPFMKENWMKGKVTVQSKKPLAEIDLKLDLVQNNFLFSRDGNDYVLTPDVTEVELYDPAKDEKLLFRRGYTIGKYINRSAFVQVLEDGNLALLKFTKKVPEEFTQYGDAAKYKRFKLVEEYYIATGGQFTQINPNRKAMEAAFGSKWPQVEAYVKQNNLSSRDESGWIKAVRYFNSL